MRNPRRIRHWKQRFDVEADMVFLKKLRMGDDPKKPYVLPGEPVTEELKQLLGKNRLNNFWRARCIGLREWYQEHIASEQDPVVQQLGRGWYNVTMPDGETRKVHGKAKLEAILQGT